MSIRVLLADDNAAFLESAANFVAHDPRVLVVGRACGGREAVQLAGALSVDLVLIDLAMPDMNGLDATRALKQLPNAPRVAIVTMHDEPEFRRTAREIGADGFIQKATFAETVFALIDELFSARPDVPNKPFQADLLNALDHAVLATDRHGRISYWNRAAERLYGWTATEACNGDLVDVIAARPSDAETTAMMRGVAEGTRWSGAWCVKRRDGNEFFADVTASPIRDAVGDLIGAVLVSCDASARHQAEKELRILARSSAENPNPMRRVRNDGHSADADAASAPVLEAWGHHVGEVLHDDSEERLRLIAEHVLDLVVQTSLDGVYLYVSPSHEPVLGYPPSSLIGRSSIDVVHPDDRERVVSVVRSATPRRSHGRLEFRVKHAKGHYIWLEAVGAILHDAAGVATAVVLTARDITDRKRLQSDLQRRTEELERFNRLAVGRELRMLELKRQINELASRLGDPLPYAPDRLMAEVQTI